MSEESEIFSIKASHPYRSGDKSAELYKDSIQESIKNIIPPHLYHQNPDFKITTKKRFEELDNLLPLVYCDIEDTSPSPLIINLICDAYFTQGTGRFVCDLFSRWLIPGKQYPLTIIRSMNFEFKNNSKKNYFFMELIINITDEKDITPIKNNLPSIINDLRMCILCVQHVRYIINSKPLNLQQKKFIIQENIASLIDRPSKEFDNTIFDQIHQLLIKASAENKVTQLQQDFAPLLETQPKAFDRDIFDEMQHFSLLFHDNFTAMREVKHLYRLISYQYLFRKSLINSINLEPHKRHLSIKIIRTKLHQPSETFPALGILVSINLFEENEVFEDRHLLRAIQSSLPGVQKVKNSYIRDRRGNKKMCLLYMEVKKSDHTSFTFQEIKSLRASLPGEIKSRIETVIHPLFIHRNEEEVMRNILILSKQLKYVDDLPQVIINFHKQIGHQLSFLIVMLRLIKGKPEPVKSLIETSSPHLVLTNCDIKMVGMLKKRYPKEANVIEVRLEKKQFLRKDYSLDLYKARQTLITELTYAFGEIRDYNGGMISKQQEVLSKLKELIHDMNINNDFLLENFFYSLKPAHKQSLIDPPVLKTLFLLMLQTLNHDFLQERFVLKHCVTDNYAFSSLTSIEPSLIEIIKMTLEESPLKIDFTTTHVQLDELQSLNFLIHYQTPDEFLDFQNLLRKGAKTWQTVNDTSIKEFKSNISIPT